MSFTQCVCSRLNKHREGLILVFCICVYVYTCIYVCTHVDIHAHIYVCLYVYMHFVSKSNCKCQSEENVVSSHWVPAWTNTNTWRADRQGRQQPTSARWWGRAHEFTGAALCPDVAGDKLPALGGLEVTFPIFVSSHFTIFGPVWLSLGTALCSCPAAVPFGHPF